MFPTLALTLTLSAAQPLDAEARQHFGAQLSVLVARVQSQLREKGVRCVLGPAPGSEVVPGKDPSSWISEQGRESQGTLEPQKWNVFLVCEQQGKASFRMGVTFLTYPALVPTTQVRESADGWVIRNLGGDVLALIVGAHSVTDPKDGIPRQERPALRLAQPLAAMVAAEEGPGKPSALEVLKMLEPKGIGAALTEAASMGKAEPVQRAQADAMRPAAADTRQGLPLEVPYVASDAPPPTPIRIPLKDMEHIGLVQRTLASEELAYFATLRARVAAAVAKALAQSPRPCRYLPTNYGDETGTVGADGLAPRRLDIDFECRHEPSPIHLLVRPAWRNRPDKDATSTKALGDDARLLVRTGGRFSTVSLAVGPTLAPPAEPEVIPGLLRLGAVELTVIGDATQVGAATALLEQLNVTPIRALLANPPLPPVVQRISSTPRKASGQTRAEREAAVYRAIFELRSAAQVVVSEKAATSRIAEGFAPLARAAGFPLSQTAITDFNRAAAKSEPLPEVQWTGPVVRLGAKEMDALFPKRPAKGHDGWKVFRERYPKANGILTLSRVGFSEDGTQAIVSVAWQGDWLAGAGEVWFLELTAEGGKRVLTMRLWVS